MNLSLACNLAHNSGQILASEVEHDLAPAAVVGQDTFQGAQRGAAIGAIYRFVITTPRPPLKKCPLVLDKLLRLRLFRYLALKLCIFFFAVGQRALKSFIFQLQCLELVPKQQ